MSDPTTVWFERGDGFRLAALRWGQDHSGTPLLVILHGFLEQALAWERVASRLERPVLALDQRGHGQSDHVGSGSFYAFWDYVADLDAVLERISPDVPVDLLGHSMGGTVACLYAGSRPERVRRLVLVEGLGPPDSTADAISRARTFLAHRRRGPSHGAPMASLAEAAARIRRTNPSIPTAFAMRLAQRQTVHVPGGLQWRWDPRHRWRSPRPFDADTFALFLREIRAPTLVVHGGRSTFSGAERARHLRDARLHVLADAGHAPHHDTPGDLADLIEAHLRT